MTLSETPREVLLPSILKLIGVSDRALLPRELRTFSGLEPHERSLFWPIWITIGDQRRIEIAQALNELTEDTVEFNFNQLWLWLLEDSVSTVRVVAIEGLWEHTTIPTMQRMLGLLQRDPAPEARAAAAIALGRFAYLAICDELDTDSDQLRATLLATVRDQSQPLDVRRRALESVSYFGDSEEIHTLIEAAYKANEQLLRESALIAMGRSMDPRWLPVIGRELSSPSPALRYEAAHAAGEMGEDARALLPKLLPALDDNDNEVAVMAIWALGQIGGPGAQRTLERITRSQDSARSQAASDALAELDLDDLKM
jgi:HEAT repeat protein